MYQFNTPDHVGAVMTDEKAYIVAVFMKVERNREYGRDYWFTPADDRTPEFGTFEE